jgi:hypothetical protein
MVLLPEGRAAFLSGAAAAAMKIFQERNIMDQFYKKRMDDGCPADPSLAMGYVPWQYFTRAYEPQKAMNTGTIFPELDKPFLGAQAGGRRR